MSVAGLLAGLAGATDLLGTTHQMASSYGTTVGFDAIAVALLGRTSPSGSCSPRCCSARCGPGRHPMQIQAGIPVELVDVLQATILFFLVASPVIARLFRIRGAKTGLDEATTITNTYGGEATIR